MIQTGIIGKAGLCWDRLVFCCEEYDIMLGQGGSDWAVFVTLEANGIKLACIQGSRTILG